MARIYESGKSLEERLDILELKIDEPTFRQTSGKANEVNYWVFDYDPKDEMTVRAFIDRLQNKHSEHAGYELKVFDLYDVIVDYLESKSYIEKSAGIEEKSGLGRLVKAIQNSLRMSNKDNFIVKHIVENTPTNSVVLLTGIGKCYPLLQAPEVFNKVLYNMPQAYMSVPMILFYPGTYNEQELIVFDELKEDNYYRAFRIVR